MVSRNSQVVEVSPANRQPFKFVKYYMPSGDIGVWVLHSIAYAHTVFSSLGHFGHVDIEDDRFVVYLPTEFDINIVPAAVINKINEAPDGDKETLSTLVKGDGQYEILAKLGYYYGALRYRVVTNEQYALTYVLTFVPKRRTYLELLRRVQNAVGNYIETKRQLYGTEEHIVSQLLREIHFSLRYNYYVVDDMCTLLWTIWNDLWSSKVNIYQSKLCQLEFIKHLYDP